jgi:hypothetical protein
MRAAADRLPFGAVTSASITAVALELLRAGELFVELAANLLADRVGLWVVALRGENTQKDLGIGTGEFDGDF